MKNRNYTIDTMKGIGIFLVVGHLMSPRSPFIYSFHMPLFFLLGGFSLVIMALHFPMVMFVTAYFQQWNSIS